MNFKIEFFSFCDLFLYQGFSKYDPLATSINIIRELVRNYLSLVPALLEVSEMGVNSLSCSSLSQDVGTECFEI